MKRCVRALIISSVTVIGVAAFNGMQTRDARADRAQPDISDCMSFRNEVKQRSIVMRAKNECDRKLNCSLSYAVRCEDNHGKRTSTSAERAHFALDSEGSTELVLSAERCQQGWTIDDVTWRCE
ncbi:MAG TPA: hypothetical protein VER12_09820 [Polyangiaceae bacterium]|nr:hypothetical protein [Polyangiaceae bacterium]